jgi:hypothetical protein
MSSTDKRLGEYVSDTFDMLLCQNRTCFLSRSQLLLEKLGSGAHGSVFRAHHENPARGRECVAIKIINEQSLKQGMELVKVSKRVTAFCDAFVAPIAVRRRKQRFSKRCITSMS